VLLPPLGEQSQQQPLAALLGASLHLVLLASPGLPLLLLLQVRQSQQCQAWRCAAATRQAAPCMRAQQQLAACRLPCLPQQRHVLPAVVLLPLLLLLLLGLPRLS
jgi:hypothetical protein